MSSYVFQSSIYDPDLTGVGHQPLWRDQLALLYNRYRVIGVKYEVIFRNSNVNQLTWAYIKYSDSATLETNPNTLIERKEGRFVMLDSLNGRSNRVKGYMPVNRSFGLSKKEFYDDDGFIANILANPTKMAYLHIYAMTLNSSALVHAQVNLTFYTEFLDRVLIAGS